MIPDEKLLEIITHAAKLGIDVKITDYMNTVTFSLYENEALVYNKTNQIQYIKNGDVDPSHWNGVRPIEWIKSIAEYYNDMLKIATMLQENIIPNEDVEP